MIDLSIENLIQLAIKEDIGSGDHTSLATIPQNRQGKAHLLIKEAGILAGVEVARKVFELVDSQIEFNLLLQDGTKILPGDSGFSVSGNSISLLSAERLALNYLQRMSGIATKTHQLVSLLEGLPTRLLDTRKTTPGMRVFEKEAVRIGGGSNHRFGLYDMILIKNNHVDFAGGVQNALMACRNYIELNHLDIKIEIEVRDFEELNQAIIEGGFDRIMLDNFSVPNMRKAVEIIGKRFETEASGGITESTLRDYAGTGVDFISVGALTHHIRSLDMSLRAIV
jgi:nicotinate-nucleotide pyrophosphorylase (carboxylating)